MCFLMQTTHSCSSPHLVYKILQAQLNLLAAPPSEGRKTGSESALVSLTAWLAEQKRKPHIELHSLFLLFLAETARLLPTLIHFPPPPPHAALPVCSFPIARWLCTFISAQICQQQ